MPTLSLTLSDELYQSLEQESQKAGVSVKDYLIGLIPKKQNEPIYLIDFLKDLPIASFKDKDPLEIQRRMRDEWE